MDIKPIPLHVRAPAEIVHPSIFYQRSSFSQSPVGTLQSIPAVWRAEAGLHPGLGELSVHSGESQGDKLASALTDHFKLPVKPDENVCGLLTEEPGLTETEEEHGKTEHRVGIKLSTAGEKISNVTIKSDYPQ